MRFVCDIDNVIVDWQSTWVELYELWFDREVDPALLGTWNACLDGTHFETMDEFFFWFSRADGWRHANTKPVPGALGAFWHLQRARVDTVLCTSRPVQGITAAHDLSFTLSGTPQVHFLNNFSKHLVPGTIWLDDSPEVLTSLVENGKTAIRFDQPWNRDLPAKVNKKLLVAHNWDDVLDILGVSR